jgi:hypothetical protein
VFRAWVESEDFIAVHADAHERGLSVVLVPDPHVGLPEEKQPIRLFIVQPEQMWRIAAFRELWDSFHESDEGWTWASEIQMSRLLGYTKKQRTAWIEALRWERGWWGRAAVHYVLLSNPQRDGVVALGKRAFADPTGLTFFGQHACGMKRNAAALVPKGITIARFGMPFDFGCKILGHPHERKRTRGVASGVVSKTIAPRINAQLRTKIEFLGARGWS